MSVENSWKSLSDGTDELLSSLLLEGSFQKLHSHSPLMKIKRLLGFNFWCAVVLSVAYLILFFYFPYWPILLTVGILFLFTVGGAYTSYKMGRDIQPYIGAERPLLSEMEKHYYAIKKWGDVQMKAAIFVYPFAAAGGFMLGGMLGSGKSIEFFMRKPIAIISLIVAIAVLLPISLYFAKFLFKKGFGKHLELLKKNIDQLKRTE